MRKGAKQFLGGLALVVGAVGAAGVYLKNRKNRGGGRNALGNVWARPGMLVTFRAELMPGRDREERTFRVNELLPSGRVSLHGVDGEHAEREFERVH
jgi:hypothetical protein